MKNLKISEKSVGKMLGRAELKLILGGLEDCVLTTRFVMKLKKTNTILIVLVM